MPESTIQGEIYESEDDMDLERKQDKGESMTRGEIYQSEDDMDLKQKQDKGKSIAEGGSYEFEDYMDSKQKQESTVQGEIYEFEDDIDLEQKQGYIRLQTKGNVEGCKAERRRSCQVPLLVKSPIELVNRTVSLTDNVEATVVTFRTCVIGLSFHILLALATQFSTFFHAPITFPPYSLYLITFLSGKSMEHFLPANRMARILKWTFNLNPGPFSIKEHALIYIFVVSGQDNPFALSVITIQKVFNRREVNIIGAFLLILTTQMLGYGFVGLVRRFFVDNSWMWWPYCLIEVSMYRTLHEEEERKKGHLSTKQMFIIVTIGSFVYSILPSFLFPGFSSLSIFCMIFKNSVVAQQLGSGTTGLGLGSFSFDWSMISNNFLGNPLGTPFSTILHIIAGLIFFYIACLLTYWNNFFGLRKFPFHSNNLYDSAGNKYNITRILDRRLTFNKDQYRRYSKVNFSVVSLYAIGFDLSQVVAAFTQFFVFNFREIWSQLKSQRCEGLMEDGHSELMKRYEKIPESWFFATVFFMGILAACTLQVFNEDFQLPYWGVLLASLLNLAMLFPISAVNAITGHHIFLNTVSEVFVGYLIPGNAIANLIFKSFGFSIMYHAQGLLHNLKLGQYLKIPPKTLFLTQILGGFLSCLANFSIAWMMVMIKNICSGEEWKWPCLGEYQARDNSVIWGAIGPKEILDDKHFPNVFVFVALGVLVPVIIRILSSCFPEKKWIGRINAANIFAAATLLPVAGAVNFWAWGFVGLISYMVYTKKRPWWERYTYVVGNGLDAGVSLFAGLVSITLHLQNIKGIERLWGSEPDHCPLAQCPTQPGLSVKGCPSFQ